MSNGYDAQDMATQGADGFRNGYQAGYADAVKAVEVGKPAAAHEAVVWGIRIGASDSWGYTNNEEQADFIGKQSGLPYEKKPLYAAPVAAAPVVRRAIADEAPFGLSTAEKVAWARGVNDALEYISTPAAPGIDLGQIWERAHADMLARRRRNKHDCFVLRCLKDSVDALAVEQIDASPKGGSDVQMVPYQRALDLIGDAYNAGTHGIGYSQQAMELHDALQATSAEVGS